MFTRCPANPRRKHVRADGAEAEGFSEVRALNLALGHCRQEGVAIPLVLVAIDFAWPSVASS